ncbi:C40 family peptidase [Gordonia sp. CPCC 206044]|uniref:C40 family peptidase n=1 Tax=Gordonia sp. CPCC 206044 TaxID=3140793 RepID=UPI003AF39FC2
MLTVEILIGPLRILVSALGTGVLPPGNAADRLRTAAPQLDRTRRESTHDATRLAQDWRGAGGDGATAAARRADHALASVTDDSTATAGVIEDASATVKLAADQLTALIDSFRRIAASLGQTLYTPQGLAMILPVALDHIGRGLQVVARTQAELRDDTDRVLAMARHTAPADATFPTAGRSDGGVGITLPDGSVVQAPDQRAATAVRAALGQRGVPYVWGGTTPNGFDCSGLTQWAYRQAGVDLPRLAQDQDTAGVPVSRAHLQPGDLAVWDGHVAMYVGNGQMVEAGDPVQISPVRTTNAGQGFQGFFRPR